MSKRPGRRFPWFTHTCTCGKHAYSNKKRAKRAARTLYPNDRMNVYQCPQSTAVLPAWHYGHLNPYVRDQKPREATHG
jgi:hypothetical protein